MRRLLLAAALAAVCRADPRAPEVQLEEGGLRGKWLQSHFAKRSVAAFEGVPYAQPPVGALRFQPPVATASWSGLRDAVQISPVCVQRDYLLGKPDIEGSEDCLYLNVYVPETVSRLQPLPVMVFIHGGGFNVWSATMFGPDLLMDRDVVYVNFNYRLGPLGFLSTGDDVIPGNYGMKDMVMALSWVQKNIRSFGGDPDSVTIFGESAGGAAVHYLTLSPLAKGLFHRAIPMSGCALGPWAFHDRATAKKTASKLAALLGCPAQPSEQLQECLQGKSAEDIIATHVDFSQWYGHPLVPFRVVDEAGGPGAFVDRRPDELVPHDVPLMIGTVSDEGCILSSRLLGIPDAMRDLQEKFNKVAPLVTYLYHLPEKVQTDLSQEIRTAYFGDKPIDTDAKQELTDLLSDAYFQHPTANAVRHHKKHVDSPVFYYKFAHHSDDRSFSGPFSGYALNSSFDMCHCDDLMYLFPLKQLFSQDLSPSDRAYTDLMLDLFTSFAATGRPTSDGSWTEVQKADEAEYAYIPNAGELTMRQNVATDKHKLWSKVEAARRAAPPSQSTNEEL